MSNSLAKNSLALAFRMVLRLVISLYTTRVVLEVLGKDSYGIYVLVAGFTVMFAFVNSSMSTAVSRFLSYSIGEDENPAKLKETFSNALFIQAMVALAVLILGGIIGYSLLAWYLDFPADLRSTVYVLFACTLAGLVFQVLQVPYNAAIIAYEKMSAYAYIEVVNSLMLLLVAFVLKMGFSNPLLVYGFLVMAVYIITFMAYAVYCRRFPACKFRFACRRDIVKPMLSFSVADLFSTSSMSVQTQGQNVIFNKFYGLTANASIGLANQIYGAITMFSSSITTAIRPRIIKSYAAGDKKEAVHLSILGARILSMGLIVISVPIIFRIDEILRLWLGNYPPEAAVFAAIILAQNAMFGYKGILAILMHASGKIERFSITAGLWYLIAIPLQYALSAMGVSATVSYAIIFLLSAGNILINFHFISKHVPLSFGQLMSRYAFAPFVGAVLCFVAGYFLNGLFGSGFFPSLAYGLADAAVSAVICWFTVLNGDSRQQLSSLASRMMSRLKH